MQEWQLPPRIEYTESNPLNGAAIAQGSIPPNRIIIKELSALTANIGKVLAGNIIIGDPAGARVEIGDNVDGLLITDYRNRSLMSFVRENGGMLSVGADKGGAPMMWIEPGNPKLYIHGDAVVTGTLRTSALILPGPVTSTFLDSDELRIGTGTPGVDYDGFIVSDDRIGFYDNDLSVWQVDGNTGHIVTRDTTYPYLVYTSIGSGNISISNYEGAGNHYTLALRGFSDVTMPWGNDQALTTAVNLWASYGYLIIEQKIEEGRSPGVELRRWDGEQGGLWTGDILQLRNRETAEHILQIAVFDGGNGSISSPGTFSISPGQTASRIQVSTSGLNVYSGVVSFQEKSADPDDPADGWASLWLSDGTGAGDDGDIMMKITAGGSTKTATLVDFSAV